MLSLFLIISCIPKITDTKQSEVYPKEEQMPTSPLLYRNQLSNGLTYFIHQNPTPADRAELRLVVRAGSVLENDQQLGLAHFVEHMAFNGSENFPSTSLVQHMESLGMRFGAHLNAYTSFDETVYQLTVPTDNVEILETSFLILRDQAFHLRFDPEEIEKERGVVIEEWRASLGAQTRLQDQIYADIFAGAKYQERFPIGTEESLKGFEHESLKQFYHDWYRPELMAIIAVGDFDKDKVETLIKKNFSDQKNPAEAPKRIDIDIPDHSDSFVRVIADSELPSIQFRMMDQYNGTEDGTFGGYKRFIMQNLIAQVINERLGVFSQDPKAIFDGASLGHSRFNRTEESTILSAGLQEAHVHDGIAFLSTEIERLRQHGLLPEELNRAKQELTSSYEQYKIGEDTLLSHTKADELIRSYVNDEPVPGTELEYQMARYFIPRITIEEINVQVSSILRRGSGVIQLLGPEKEGLILPTEQELKKIVDESQSKNLTPYEEETVSDAPLVGDITAGSIIDKQYDPLLNMHTWTLSNGMVVYIKPTEIKQDEVLLSGFRKGGLSTISDEDYASATVAVSLKNRSGLGTFRPTELEKKLSGIELSLSNSTEQHFEEVSGIATPEHLDVLMQLMYLQMMHPKFEPSALETFKRDQYAQIEKRANNVMYPVQTEFINLLWGENDRISPWDAQTLEKIDIKKAEAIYLDKFRNGEGFSMFLVGKMEMLEVEDYVKTYLASIPSIKATETQQQSTIPLREGVHTRTVYAGNEPKASYMNMIHGEFTEISWTKRRNLQAMKHVLNSRLLKRLREEMSGVYSVSFSLDFTNAFPNQFTARLNFGCDPNRLPDLSKAALEELEKMAKEPISTEELSTEKEQGTRQREQSKASNHFWMSAIEGALKRGEDPREIVLYDERNEAITAKSIQQAAADLLKQKKGDLTLIQYPQSHKPQEE